MPCEYQNKHILMSSLLMSCLINGKTLHLQRTKWARQLNCCPVLTWHILTFSYRIYEPLALLTCHENVKLLIDGIVPGLSFQHPCQFCGKVFARSEVLKVHVRDVHENKGQVFNCEVCDQPSKSLNGLRRHMSVYHRNHSKNSMVNSILP